MVELKQFVPAEVCLSCQGCCRYHQKDTPWAPLFLLRESAELTEDNIVPCCLFSSSNNKKDEYGGGQADVRAPVKVNLIEHEDSYICPCFDYEANKCKIYANRPFDCQLYPFILVRRGLKVYLAADENCPYIKKEIKAKNTQDYIKYLVDFFTSADSGRPSGEYFQIAQRYPQDVKILAPLA